MCKKSTKNKTFCYKIVNVLILCKFHTSTCSSYYFVVRKKFACSVLIILMVRHRRVLQSTTCICKRASTLMYISHYIYLQCCENTLQNIRNIVFLNLFRMAIRYVFMNFKIKNNFYLHFSRLFFIV